MRTFVLTTQYVYNSLPTYSIKQLSIHQPNNTDVVITTPGAHSRWSHTDQSVFVNSDEIFLLSTDPLNSSDQKFVTRKKSPLFCKFRSKLSTRNRSVNIFRSETRYSKKNPPPSWYLQVKNFLLAQNCLAIQIRPSYQQTIYWIL